ncbi:MAG: RNA 2',3'-cyclic phosphodiesterase [Chloroflexi bacterium]|nr:RNA 2',3'-cyclic phosphodiesterase [Chloroflexota bacterium]
MTLLRAFIALEIPASIQQAIQQQTAGLRKSADSSLVRWVTAGNLHLTLKFLGDVSSTNVQFLTQMLSREAGQHPGFSMQLGGLGAFPNPTRPRVIWIGIRAPETLPAVYRSLEAATARLGYPPEERPFSPHLTLGRVKQSVTPTDLQRIRTALEAANVGQLGTVEVTSIHLMKSDLKPTGSVYTRLFSAPFASK